MRYHGSRSPTALVPKGTSYSERRRPAKAGSRTLTTTSDNRGFWAHSHVLRHVRLSRHAGAKHRASPAPHTHEARSTTRRATGIALSECGLASTRRRRDAGAARGANRERVRARAFRTVGVARHRPVRGLHDISSRSRFRAVSLARSLPRQPLPCNCKKVSSRRAAWACLHQPDGWVETLQR